MIRRLLFSILVTLSVAPTAIASPLEPVDPVPHLDCRQTIARIVQHETLYTRSDTIYRFMAEQVVYDLGTIPCSALTRWRWKIGDYYPVIDPRIDRIVLRVLLDNPRYYYPKCQYVGYPGDLHYWPGRLRVDYTLRSRGYTVIGVNCTGTKVP